MYVVKDSRWRLSDKSTKISHNFPCCFVSPIAFAFPSNIFSSLWSYIVAKTRRRRREKYWILHRARLWVVRIRRRLSETKLRYKNFISSDDTVVCQRFQCRFLLISQFRGCYTLRWRVLILFFFPDADLFPHEFRHWNAAHDMFWHWNQLSKARDHFVEFRLYLLFDAKIKLYQRESYGILTQWDITP